MPPPLLSPQASGARLPAEGSRQGGGRGSRRQTPPLCPVLSAPIRGDCSWADEQQTMVAAAQPCLVAVAVSGARPGGVGSLGRCSLCQAAVTQAGVHTHGARPAPCPTAELAPDAPCSPRQTCGSPHLVPPPENQPQGHLPPKRASCRRPALPAPRPSPAMANQRADGPSAAALVGGPRPLSAAALVGGPRPSGGAPL